MFEFNLNHIGYGMWVTELQRVDGEMASNNYSDPLPTRKEAAKNCRVFAERAYLDAKWGWCVR